MFILLYQEEEEEEVPEFVAEDEIEESDLSDIEVSNLELETKPSQWRQLWWKTSHVCSLPPQLPSLADEYLHT